MNYKIILSLLFLFNCIKSAQTINGEKPLVVVIPSYNNSKWYKLNLGKVFQQKYSNYRVIYIDDCSTDGTGDLVQNFIQESGQAHRVQLTRNTINKGSLYNLYHAIHSCQDDEIILDLDGDDWFAHDQVLATINAAYQDPNVWFTYGQFEIYPNGKLGQCVPMPDYIVKNRCYRKEYWITSHLRTFYAGLFKLIKKEDLIYKDSFYQVAGDLAFIFPLLEMADGHIKFIDSVIYKYNLANPLNDCRIRCGEQLYSERVIRRCPLYLPLDEEKARILFKLGVYNATT